MKAGIKSYSLDTNYILRFVLRDVEKQYLYAANIFQMMAEGKLILRCDPIILGEVVFVLQSFYKVPKVEILTALEPIFISDGLVMQNKDRYLKALSLYASSNIHFGDACACSTALEESEGRLLSFDKDISSTSGISRIESISTL